MIINPKHIYKSLHGHIIVPIELYKYNYICKVFYIKDNTIFDQGLFEYNMLGKCLEDKGERNAINRIYYKDIPKNLLKIIKIYKKKGRNHE